jgi:hypothetical protein
MTEVNENEENDQKPIQGEAVLDAAPIQVPRSNPNEPGPSDASADADEDSEDEESNDRD